MTTTTQRLTLEDYLDYDDHTDTRYELVTGVLVTMPSENPINTVIAIFLVARFLQLGVPYDRIGIKQQIVVPSSHVTAREPDLIIHSDESAAAILADGRLLRSSLPSPLLVIEIVSPGPPGSDNYDRDYIAKRQEYAIRGIPEYWIVDPDRQVIWVLTLAGEVYEQQEFTGEQALTSPTFLALQLTAAQVLNA